MAKKEEMIFKYCECICENANKTNEYFVSYQDKAEIATIAFIVMAIAATAMSILVIYQLIKNRKNGNRTY